MDAGWNPVVRGVMNGFVAKIYESDGPGIRAALVPILREQARMAVRAAMEDAERSEFRREPRIRFAHVGELPAHPEFANAMASLVREESADRVQCVVYTRHPRASSLDPDLFVVNFTLDDSSLDRRAWAPPHARLTASAWDGETLSDVDVNFLEHHRWTHTRAAGAGKTCPATLPSTQERTCDAVKCDLCFRRPLKRGIP